MTGNIKPTLPAATNGRRVDAAATFEGPLLVVAPHADDEVLGCGGTIARLARDIAVHVVVATDGRLSPLGPDGGLAPNIDVIVADRRQEVLNATAALGVPASNVHFLDFPDARLSAERVRLEAALADLIGNIQPRTVMAPFRHDQHPDHVATHRATTAVLRAMPRVRLFQYFIYHRYLFGTIPDIRQAVETRFMLRIDIEPERQMKRHALGLYPSQVTTHYPWQTRPGLSEHFVEGHCTGDEVFASFDGDTSDRALFRTLSPLFWLGLRLAPGAVQLKKRYIG